MTPLVKRESTAWPVVRVSCGNFIEMYDFIVFGYYAAAIGRAFFPSSSEFASLMKALMTFGAGYLMRPVVRSCLAPISITTDDDGASC